MWKTASFENELMLEMKKNLHKTAEEKSAKHQLTHAIDLLDEAARIFESADLPQFSDQIVNILNDAVIEANVFPFPKEKNEDFLNAEDGFEKDLCPLCGTDHQDPDNDCDFEECGYCGFDHSYESEAAVKWHKTNDPENRLYK